MNKNIGQPEGRDKSIVIAAGAKSAGNSDLRPMANPLLTRKAAINIAVERMRWLVLILVSLTSTGL